MAVCLEFLIVVVGVYLGIQISNWNESRLEDERGARYLERIHTDLSSDLDRMDFSAAYWSKVIEFGTIAIAYAEGGQLFEDSAQATVLAFFQASQIMPYVTNSTTYMEMRSSGDLGLIDSGVLREQLAQYYTAGIDAGASHLTQLVPPCRESIRELTPFAIQEFV